MDHQKGMRGNLNQIIIKENLVEDLTKGEEIILEKDLIGEEEIIMEKDLTGEEESQPTKVAVGEITRVILLLNLRIRALGTVVENHLVKDSSV